MTRLKRLRKWFLARFRLDLDVVCEMSKGRGMWDDFHDYHDDKAGLPSHFIPLTCKRCRKEFYI